MSEQTLEEFKAERNAALIALDVEWARKMARAACARTGRSMPDDAVLLASLHKARYDCTELPDEYRHSSRAWLADRGLGRMSGLPLLPEGELERRTQ